jgi:hypothetical protein
MISEMVDVSRDIYTSLQPCRRRLGAISRRQKDATTRLSRPGYVPPYGPGFKGELSLLCGALSVPYRIGALQRQTQRLKSDDQKHEHIVLPAGAWGILVGLLLGLLSVPVGYLAITKVRDNVHGGDR